MMDQLTQIDQITRATSLISVTRGALMSETRVEAWLALSGWNCDKLTRLVMVGSRSQEQDKITHELRQQPNGSPHFISGRYQGVLGGVKPPP
jgi:hypothetical protein